MSSAASLPTLARSQWIVIWRRPWPWIALVSLLLFTQASFWLEQRRRRFSREVGRLPQEYADIPHIGSLQAQGAAQTRWEHHSQVLQGQSIAGLSNKRCGCSRRAPFLSVFIVLVSPASGVKPH